MALEGTGFSLVLRRVASLRPHEDTIPANVERIASEIKRDGVQKDPMIVDGDSGTVLDGMHRLAAFDRLGLENAVCCSVDYSSDSVSLRRWVRVYSAPSPSSLLKLIETRLTRRATQAEAFDLLDSRETTIAAISHDGSRIAAESTTLSDAFGLVRELDSAASRSGRDREFVPEDEVDVPLQDKEKVVVMVRRISKDDVVTAAKTGRMFPCKTSMHSIDPRPVGIGYPIRSLNSATNKDLAAWMAEHTWSLTPPDTLYEGRRYKERLLLLARA